ncbi:MAG: hypothetical protein K2P78_02090 [Gemmataceae bacterium]|nr:hypothetical protein [Gemmataceae bacterium]
MTTRLLLAGALVAAAAGLTGCGPPGKVKEEEIAVKPQQALEQARSLLKNYADGQPLGSEVSTFDSLVADVKKEDAERGAILEQGLKEIQAPKANVRAKAKELLGKLAPKQQAG